MKKDSEDYLREWFRTGPLPNEPESLHDFLAAVPLEHPRTMRNRWSMPSIWPQRALAGLAAAVVVAVVGGSILFGLMNRSNTPIPGTSSSASATASASNPTPTASPSPTATASGSAPTETASPTLGTGGLANLPKVTVPAAAIKTATGTANGVSFPALDSVASQVWGSRYYSAGWTAVDAGLKPTSNATAILRYEDVSAATAGSVPLPLTQAELVGLRTNIGGGFRVATDGSSVAVVVWYRLGPLGQQYVPCASNAGAPIAWRILVAPIDQSTGRPGTFSEIAGAQSKVAFSPFGSGEGCDTVAAPLVSLSGGRIAYNIENATVGRPLASTIVVRSLAGGVPEREVATPAMPIRLGLSGTNVAWLESDGNVVLSLRISTAAHPAPADVEAMTGSGQTGPAGDIPRFSLEGDQIAWESYETGKVFVESIGGSAAQISPSGAVCYLNGMDAGTVLLSCADDPAFSGLGGTLVVWSQAAGLQLVQGYPAAASGFSWLSNGWVATETDSGLSIFRVSDLSK